MRFPYRIALALWLSNCGLVRADEHKVPSAADLREAAARRFPQPVVVGTLIGRSVLRPVESQQVLGRVEGIVRQTDGTLDAVVRFGGLFGFHSRPIAVPVDAMVLVGDVMEIMDFTPEQLNGFPTFESTGTTPVAADETIRVGLAHPSH